MTADNELDSIVEEERIYATSQTTRTDALNIDKGCGALMRFLPMKLGPRGTWFLRVGRHWINRWPYNCKKTSSPDVGGDPEYDCPLCRLYDQYNNDADEKVSKRAYSTRGDASWVMYGFIWQREDVDGQAFDVSRTEAYKPFTHWFRRNQWVAMLDLYKRSKIKAGPLGFMDPFLGHDIWLRKDNNNKWRIDREDPQAIAATEEESIALAEKIMAKAKVEEYRMLSDDKIEDALDKMEDYILVSRTRHRTAESDDEPEPRPSSRRAPTEPAPRSRRSPRPDPEDAPPPSRGHSLEPEDSDPNADPDLDPPSPSRRRAEAPPTRRAAPAEPPRRAAASTERAVPTRATPPPARRTVEPPASEPAPADDETDPNDPLNDADESPIEEPDMEAPPPVHASPPPSVRRTAAPPPTSSRKIEDDPEDLPPETHDAAPPITTAATSDKEVPRRPRLSSLLREGVRAAQEAGNVAGPSTQK